MKSALFIFINLDIYKARKEVYLNIIKEKFHNKNYSDVFLLGLDSMNLIRAMDWIKLKTSAQEYWLMPFVVGESARRTIEGITLNFEKHLKDRLNHIKCKQIDYCFDYCRPLQFANIAELVIRLKSKGYEIKELQITDILS